MEKVPDQLPLLPFRISVSPSAIVVGQVCEGDDPAAAVFLFRYGDATASHRVENVWTACCEIYLQAQLARQEKLSAFSLNGEQLFEIAYFDDAAVCSWSPEHVFAVERHEFVESFEGLVEQVLAGMSDRRVDEFVQLGASLLLARPDFGKLL